MNQVNLFVTIIMFVSTYPILLILYFCQMAAVDEKKNSSLFGIRCSSEWMPDSERCKLAQTYHKRMKRLLLVMALIPFVTLPIPYFSISLTIWMVWTLALCAVFSIPYAQGFNRVRELKQAHGLLSDRTEISLYELKNAGSVHALHILDLLPLTILNLGIALFALLHFRGERLQTYGTLIAIFALCSLSCAALGILMDRMKTRVISQNSDININYARANKKLWKRFWLTSSWLTTAFTAILLIYCLLPDPSDKISFWLCMAGSMILCLITLAQIACVADKKQKLDRLYEKERDLTLDQDDERHWIGGILYYNPRDRHTLVERKVGIGSTFNMATPVGKGMTAIGVLGLMLIPLSCVWLILEEFTPINLTLQGETLIAEHINTEYTIRLEDITSMELLKELPKGSKVHGTNMSALEKGTFRNSVDGRVEECLNPMEEIFLRIETADTIYYLGSYSKEATMELYESLCRELPRTPPSLP